MDRRENILATMLHQSHDHVANAFTDVFTTGVANETFEIADNGKDGFGLEWVSTASGLGGALPAPGKSPLADITTWEDTVKFPDLDAYDWAGQAERQLANYKSAEQIQEYNMTNGPFLRLTSMMGFEEGLIAMAEEAEATAAFLDAIADYIVRKAERVQKYFHPEVLCICDDVATERGPFMSPESYKRIIAPSHKKIFDAVRSLGMIPSLHVCGKCDSLVGMFCDVEGAEIWEVCQPENDLVALGSAYGGRLAFLGGYDMQSRLSYEEPSQEEVRKSVRDAIDLYAPAGNYAFMGMLMYADIEKTFSLLAVINDEALRYGTDWYLRN